MRHRTFEPKPLDRLPSRHIQLQGAPTPGGGSGYEPVSECQRRPRQSESGGRLPPLQLEGVAGGGRAEPGRVDAGRATRGGDRRLGHN